MIDYYQPVVRPDAAVHHADMVADLLDLGGGMVLYQEGFMFLLCCQHYTIASLNKLIDKLRLVGRGRYQIID